MRGGFATDELRDLREDLPQRHILAAQDVALAGAAALKRQEMARGDVIDVDDVETRIDVGRRSPAAASRTICPVGVGFTSPGPIGVDGLTMTTGNPLRAASRTTSSARNFERL